MKKARFVSEPEIGHKGAAVIGAPLRRSPCDDSRFVMPRTSFADAK